MSNPLTPGKLSTEELDHRLVQSARAIERAERLVVEDLVELRDRRGYEQLGFSTIWDYTAERLGFSYRKTGYWLKLGDRLRRLPRLAEALASGRLGWTKAELVSRVAEPEDEVKWVESALALSFRELERRIREDVEVTGGRVSFWLSLEQTRVWERAVETCRRVAGVDLDLGDCLELIAAEFLSTYEAPAAQASPPAEPAPDRPPEPGALSEPRAAASAGEPLPDDGPVEEGQQQAGAPEQAGDLAMCPEDDREPSPAAAPDTELYRRVLDRDHYRCRFPACSSRRDLHEHHIDRRSRHGSQGWEENNQMSNRIVLCQYHHRLIHRGEAGVSGSADAPQWRLPEALQERPGIDGGEVEERFWRDLIAEGNPTAPGLQTFSKSFTLSPREGVKSLAASTSPAEVQRGGSRSGPEPGF